MRTEYALWCPEGHQVWGGANPPPDPYPECQECDEPEENQHEDYTLRTHQVPDPETIAEQQECMAASAFFNAAKLRRLFPDSRAISIYRGRRESQDFTFLATFTICETCDGLGRHMEVTEHGDHLGRCIDCQGIGYTKEKSNG
jgi:hypothetical protein